MKCATWGYKVTEEGKVLPVKIKKVIDENIINSVVAKLKGEDLNF